MRRRGFAPFWDMPEPSDAAVLWAPLAMSSACQGSFRDAPIAPIITGGGLGGGGEKPFVQGAAQSDKAHVRRPPWLDAT